MADKQSVFDMAEIVEEPVMEEENGPSETQEEEWNPTVQDESPKERLARLGEKKEANDKVLTIKAITFTRPKMKNPDGSRVEPKLTLDSKKPYYPGKLCVRFEEDNLVEYYPNFHYYLNDKGDVSKFAKINRTGDNAVTKIFNLVVAKLGRPADEVSDAEVWQFLKGKKVKISTSKGKYMGKDWFRNDIVAIQ